MKFTLNAIFLLLMIGFLISCNKSNNPNQIPLAQNSLPKIASLYLPVIHVKDVYYFNYDKQSRLSAIRAYSYDSSSGNPVLDSFYINFTLDTSLNPPFIYNETMYYQGDIPSGEIDHHLLFYDAQNRVTIDSITSSGQNDFSVQHYLYDNNGNTTIQWLFGDPNIPGSYKVNQMDTMNIQNDNLITDNDYNTLDGDIDHLYTRSYSPHLNPIYNSALANSLGCLMVFNNFVFDFKSKYLPTEFNSTDDGTLNLTIDYLWTNDATGSVISGIGKDKKTGLVQQVYTYTY